MRVMPVVLLALATGTAGAQTPAINSVTPSAVAPGQTAELTIHGASLDKAATFWTNVPAASELVRATNETATVRLTVPATVPVGVGALRVATPGGASNLQFFMVDDLPTVAERAGNASPGGAQGLAAPVAVEGACEPLAHDYYRIAGKRGRRVSIEVVAARLGSQLDPVLRLLDASGRELAWADDTAGAGGDCRLAHTFAADGEYLIELRDVNYDGGSAYRYRLRIGDFPLPVVPFPLGGKRGTVGAFMPLGDRGDGAPVALAAIAPGAQRTPVSWRGAGGSGFAGVIAGDLDETVEAEPNDVPASATPLAVPTAVSGRFESAGDVDVYRLALRKGERWSFRARSRSLGSPCDPVLQLLRPGGAKVAESKVEGAADAALDATAPEEGVYLLRVRELTGAAGPALGYRIEAEPYRPGFLLSVDADKVDARARGEFELKVTASRRDYGGPIALAVEGLEPAALSGATMPAGKQEATLKVKLPADLPGGSIVHFRVTGSADVPGGRAVATASTAPALRRLLPRMLYPPEDLDGEIALGVRPAGR